MTDDDDEYDLWNAEITEEEIDKIQAMYWEGVKWPLISGLMGHSIYRCRAAAFPEWRQLQTDNRRKSWSRIKGTCPMCGEPSSYYGWRHDSESLCRNCWLWSRRWTRERVVAAMQRFEIEHGRLPTTGDWRKADAANGYPSRWTVCGSRGPFPTWRAAIEAASER